MHAVADFFQHVWQHPSSLFNPEAVIRYGGLTILFLTVFAETGLFFCFFFPGDSLVFTAGVLCATHELHGGWIGVNLAMVTAAVLGNMCGFYIGRRSGKMLLKRDDSIFFKKAYVKTADDFYKKYGGAALVFGRFVPIVRTFAPIVAGILNLSYRRYLFLSVAGAVAWVLPLMTLGYFLGKITWVEENLGYIVIGMVVGITSPVIFKLIKEFKRTKKLHTV